MICRFCKKEIPKGTEFKKNPTDRNYYCNEEHWQMSQDKKKYKPQKKTNDGNDNPRRLFLDYIQELYVSNGWDKHDINWKLITSIIKNMMDEDKAITYGGMKYTLWYCKEIKEIDLFSNKSNSVMWAIPFYYQEAQKYYEQTEQLEIKVESFDFKDNEKIVKNSVNKIRHLKKIPIDNLV